MWGRRDRLWRMLRFLTPLALVLACTTGTGPAPVPTPDPRPGPDPAPTPAQAGLTKQPDAQPRVFEIQDDGWIEGALREDGRFEQLLADPAKYRLQILVTELVPGEEGPVKLVTHGYRVDAEFTFAASAIKTVASIAALRRLQRIDEPGVGLDTPMALCGPKRGPCDKTEDKSNLRGQTITLGHELRKMHLVSNNKAFNRLYDFVGHREINEDLAGLGFASVRIRHRMGQQYTLGKTTPRMEFLRDDGPYVVERRTSDLALEPTQLPGILVGVAYYGRDHQRFDEPRDFSRKNHISTADLHRLQLSIVLPDHPAVPDLGLSDAHQAALLAAMTENPESSANPKFDRPRLTGRRYKLMSTGIERKIPLEQIRYVNKPGKAYGFHVENAYVEHLPTGRSFFVTASLYVNDNEVINDDHYEYEQISRPFFRDLGELLADRLLLAE